MGDCGDCEGCSCKGCGTVLPMSVETHLTSVEIAQLQVLATSLIQMGVTLTGVTKDEENGICIETNCPDEEKEKVALKVEELMRSFE